MRGLLARISAWLSGGSCSADGVGAGRSLPPELAIVEKERKELKKEMIEHDAAYARRMAVRVERVGMGTEARTLKKEAARKEAQARAIGEDLLDEEDLLRLIGVAGDEPEGSG